MTDSHQQETYERRGYPLSAVVLFVTFVACALVCVDMPKIRDSVDWASGHPLMGAGMLGGLSGLIGGLIGLLRPRRWRGLLYGAISGFVAGPFLAMIVFAPAHPLQAFGAMVLLLGTSVGLRWNTV